jgi:hypothetical protein
MSTDEDRFWSREDQAEAEWDSYHHWPAALWPYRTEPIITDEEE